MQLENLALNWKILATGTKRLPGAQVSSWQDCSVPGEQPQGWVGAESSPLPCSSPHPRAGSCSAARTGAPAQRGDLGLFCLDSTILPQPGIRKRLLSGELSAGMGVKKRWEGGGLVAQRVELPPLLPVTMQQAAAP